MLILYNVLFYVLFAGENVSNTPEYVNVDSLDEEEEDDEEGDKESEEEEVVQREEMEQERVRHQYYYYYTMPFGTQSRTHHLILL